jgi:hypothetical protein
MAELSSIWKFINTLQKELCNFFSSALDAEMDISSISIKPSSFIFSRLAYPNVFMLFGESNVKSEPRWN